MILPVNALTRKEIQGLMAGDARVLRECEDFGCLEHPWMTGMETR